MYVLRDNDWWGRKRVLFGIHMVARRAKVGPIESGSGKLGQIKAISPLAFKTLRG